LRARWSSRRIRAANSGAIRAGVHASPRDVWSRRRLSTRQDESQTWRPYSRPSPHRDDAGGVQPGKRGKLQRKNVGEQAGCVEHETVRDGFSRYHDQQPASVCIHTRRELVFHEQDGTGISRQTRSMGFCNRSSATEPASLWSTSAPHIMGICRSTKTTYGLRTTVFAIASQPFSA
jgi:hypothetical protein